MLEGLQTSPSVTEHPWFQTAPSSGLVLPRRAASVRDKQQEALKARFPPAVHCNWTERLTLTMSEVIDLRGTSLGSFMWTSCSSATIHGKSWRDNSTHQPLQAGATANGSEFTQLLTDLHDLDLLNVARRSISGVHEHGERTPCHKKHSFQSVTL